MRAMPKSGEMMITLRPAALEIIRSVIIRSERIIRGAG
jgi:hypothetical protein